MNLKTWLKNNNVTQNDFAKMIGRSQGRVSQIIRSGTNSADEVEAIRRATDSAVSFEDLRPRAAA